MGTPVIPTADWPVFVKTEDDKVRWKASLDFITMELGLEFPKDIDMLNIFARSVFHNPEIPTEGLLSLTSGVPFNPNPERSLIPVIPGRFDQQLEADPTVLREAVAQAGKLKWENGTASINGVLVTLPPGQTAATVVTRLCYLLSPFYVGMGQWLTLTLESGPSPQDNPDNPSMVTALDGNVTFWKVGELNAGGAKIDESVFDYTVARALRTRFDEEDYRAVVLADKKASEKFALKYQKTKSRSLGTDIGPVAVVGAPFATIYGKDQPLIADFTDSLSLWLCSQRHGHMPYSNGEAYVKFSDVFPNRDRYFKSWS